MHNNEMVLIGDAVWNDKPFCKLTILLSKTLDSVVNSKRMTNSKWIKESKVYVPHKHTQIQSEIDRSKFEIKLQTWQQDFICYIFTIKLVLSLNYSVTVDIRYLPVACKYKNKKSPRTYDVKLKSWCGSIIGNARSIYAHATTIIKEYSIKHTRTHCVSWLKFSFAYFVSMFLYKRADCCIVRVAKTEYQ